MESIHGSVAQLDCGVSTVNGKLSAGDESSIVAGQEHDRRCHVVGLAEMTDRMLRHDVELAEMLDRAAKGTDYVIFIGDIDREPDGVLAEPLGGDNRVADIEDDDLCALRDEPLSDRQPDARGAAGDYGYLA
jgi:hypothetical protein